MDGATAIPTGMVLVRGRETLRVEGWGADTIRVQAAIDGEFAPIDDALVVTAPTLAEVTIGDERAEVRSGMLRAVIDADGHLAFFRDGQDTPVLAEPPQHPLMGSQNPRCRVFHRVADGAWQVSSSFASAADERLYGLGQHALRRVDLKGCVVALEQRNAEVTIPVLVSSAGYGLLWNNPSVGRVELAANHTRWVADRTAQLDYFVYVGDTTAAVIERYYDLTGYPRPLPNWVTGFWQSKTRYSSQDELLGVAREHWRRGLPLDVILVDFFHSHNMGDWDWEPEHWPDPAGMIRELAEHGCRTIISIWPHVNPRSPNYATLRDAGQLVTWADGTPATFGFADLGDPRGVDLALYDATNPAARAFVWSEIKRHNVDLGAHAFWVDACEPELSGNGLEPLAAQARYHRGHGTTIASLYPFLAVRTFRDGLDADGVDDGVLMARSAWAGSQRMGAIVWSGDTLSSWAVLAEQVRAGLSMMLSGSPWWTSDTGGFVGSDNADEDFRELLVRWFAFCVFTPVLRLHGLRGLEFSLDDWTKSGDANELWSFGDRAYEMLRSFVFFRERLRPYVEAQLATASASGVPPMRPLWFDDPADPEAVEVDDQYLFGPDLLVAPVTEPGLATRRVYLPRGADWRDPWTATTYTGGDWITLETPLDRLPVLVRLGGSIAIDASWLEVPEGTL